MKKACALSVLLVSLCASAAAQGDYLFTVSEIEGLLRKVEPLNGQTAGSMQIVTTSNVLVQGCNGLARNPVSGVLYAIVREAIAPGVQKLATVDAQTGVATIIGPLGDIFAGLACRGDGALFGVTDDVASVPSTLWTISVATGTPTLAMLLGSGGVGESIAFASDGFLYHCSGAGPVNANQVFERIDTNALTVVPVTWSGYDPPGEIVAMTEWVGGVLAIADQIDLKMVMTTAGLSTYVSPFDHSGIKGMAIVPTAVTQPFFRLYGHGCTAVSGQIPILRALGTPTPGQTVYLNSILGPPVTTLVLGIGTGTLSAPVPSALCQVQILPIDPNLQFFTTNLAGGWVLPVTVPAIPPQDLFVQTAMVDAGGGLVLSNPLQVHVQ